MKAHEWVITLTGFVFIALGAYFLRGEMQVPVVACSPAHTQHVYIFSGLMVVGGGMIFPAFITGIVKTILDGLPLPRFGSRKEDVPLEKAPPGTPPGTPVKPVPPAPGDEDLDKP